MNCTQRFLSIAAALLAVSGRVLSFETVVIDPGHGGNDEGTAWYHAREKMLTLCVAKRLEAELNARGIHTVLTRRYDCYVGLEERAEIGNRYPNAIFVSIHFNASPAHQVTGIQSFYFYGSPSSKIATEYVQKSLVESIHSRDRGVTPKDYAVLWRTDGLGMLIECGFISNKGEGALVSSNEGQQALADGIARGLMRIKPMICNDPPEADLARCEIYAKRHGESGRRNTEVTVKKAIVPSKKVASSSSSKSKPKKKKAKSTKTRAKKETS